MIPRAPWSINRIFYHDTSVEVIIYLKKRRKDLMGAER